MNYYETLYVVEPTLNEEELKSLMSEFEEYLKSEGAEVLKSELWGKKNLAYPIKKFKQAYYVLMHYRAKPSAPKLLENRFRIKDPVLRHMTVHMLKKDIEQYKPKESKLEDPNGQPE